MTDILGDLDQTDSPLFRSHFIQMLWVLETGLILQEVQYIVHKKISFMIFTFNVKLRFAIFAELEQADSLFGKLFPILCHQPLEFFNTVRLIFITRF